MNKCTTYKWFGQGFAISSLWQPLLGAQSAGGINSQNNGPKEKKMTKISNCIIIFESWTQKTDSYQEFAIKITTDANHTSFFPCGCCFSLMRRLLRRFSWQQRRERRKRKKSVENNIFWPRTQFLYFFSLFAKYDINLSRYSLSAQMTPICQTKRGCGDVLALCAVVDKTCPFQALAA